MAPVLKPSLSLVEQVKANLKRRIFNDEFDGGRIPSETDLANELGVSRTTIRDAFSRLELEGVIYRKQGAGTFINEAGLRIRTRLEEIWGYEAMLEAHGYTPSTRIIMIEEQPVSAEFAPDLDLNANENVLKVQKLFLADGRPVILSINHIPSRIINFAWTDDDFHQPIYQFLAKFCRQQLTYYLSEIVPLIAPPWLIDTLNLPQQKVALLSFDEIGYNQNNEPIVKAYSYFQDDLVRLRLIRREVR